MGANIVSVPKDQENYREFLVMLNEVVRFAGWH